MTAVGISGTFLGIYLAMDGLSFLPADMNDSVQTLLSGMSTAFITSIMGLASSILFRFVSLFRFTRPEDTLEGSTLVVLKDIAHQLSAMRLQTKDDAEARNKGTAALLQAIGGDHAGSVASRVDKLRLDATERLDALQAAQADGFGKLDALTKTIRDALVKNLQDLVEELHESVGKAFRESLDRLIRDIEKALIDQFGKTFTEFNDATQAIKTWQERHREHVESMTEAFETAVGGMSSIAKDCSSIPDVMAQLKACVDVAQQDIDALNRQLEAFAALRGQAEQSLPVIKRHLDAIGEDLHASAEGFNGLRDTLRNTFEQTQAEAQKTIEAGVKHAERVAAAHAHNVDEMAAAMKGAMEDAQRQAAQDALKAVSEAQAHIKDMSNKFFKDTIESLHKIEADWGGNMVVIAEKCSKLIAEVRRNPPAR